MNWLLWILELTAVFLFTNARRLRSYQRHNDIDYGDPESENSYITDFCNQCCTTYSHGNEKCGLALNSHKFAFELMRSLTKYSAIPDNIVISPFSVMNILMLLSLGSSGETQYQIRQALQFPLYFKPLHDHLLMKCALMRYDGVSLKASNAVFFEWDKATSEKSFVELASHYYNVSVRGVAFRADPSQAWMSVADFIRETSNGFLDQAMYQNALSSELVFVNTIYFNGTWKFEVPTDGMKQITFYRDFRSGGSVGMVEAFEVTGLFSTGVIMDRREYGDKIRVVELPYSDDQFSMYIFKSEEGRLSMNFIEEVIKGMTIGEIKENMMETDMVTLTIPKFSITYQTDISEALVNMGVKRLFSKSRSKGPELDKMFSKSDVSADRLLHTAKITVTEAGTEAAAASLAVISRGFYVPMKITFSHPFVFVIYDSCNNLIMFQGRVVDPTR